jgi:hypothetical protein
MKKEWQTPALEVLDINMTMAASLEGWHDEAYVDNQPNFGNHHES